MFVSSSGGVEREVSCSVVVSVGTRVVGTVEVSVAVVVCSCGVVVSEITQVTNRIEYSLLPSLFTGAQISLEYKVMDVLASTVLKFE